MTEMEAKISEICRFFAEKFAGLLNSARESIVERDCPPICKKILSKKLQKIDHKISVGRKKVPIGTTNGKS